MKKHISSLQEASRAWVLLTAWVAILALSGCGSLPSSGPSTSSIIEEGDPVNGKGEYMMVPVTQNIVNVLKKSGPGNQPAGPGSDQFRIRKDREVPRSTGSTATQKLVPGDVVVVTIFTMGGGLFGKNTDAEMTGGNVTSFRPTVIDNSGQITIPHVGRIQAEGRTLHEVEQAITEPLRGKVVEPWVVVSLAERKGSDLLTVTGDVNAPQRVQVPFAGLRLLDAITQAGGSTAKDYETMVLVTRGNETRAAILEDVLTDPSKNIQLEAGDTIILKGRKWNYITFGAASQQQVNYFEEREITIAQALAQAGGLRDLQANPEAVFVYRFEPENLAKKLGQVQGTKTDEGVPVIYQLNLREPKGYFLASQFEIQDRDILFVGNAGSVGVVKFLEIINTLTAPARSGLVWAAGINAL